MPQLAEQYRLIEKIGRNNMATFYNWSTTPASNASVGNIDWAEGMAPSQVNNSARQEMADVAAWRDFFGGAKTTSGTDTITLTSGMTITAYASNQLFVAKLGGTNTGAATLNIDSLGTKAVEINGSAVTAGELVAGKFYMFVYDGTAFQASRVSAESGFTNPMTTQGDMIRGGGSGAAERVAIGAANTVLISDATDADWSKLPIASLANGTDGELITWDAAGAPAVVAVGTSGQILTSGGAGVAPTFATPSGGRTLLAESLAFSAQSVITFDGYFASNDMIEIHCFDMVPAAAGDVELRYEVKVGGAWATASYASYMVRGLTAVSSTAAATGVLGYMRGTNSAHYIELPRPDQTVDNKTLFCHGVFDDTTYVNTTATSQYQGATGAVTGIRFKPGSSTFSGSIQVWGS